MRSIHDDGTCFICNNNHKTDTIKLFCCCSNSSIVPRMNWQALKDHISIIYPNVRRCYPFKTRCDLLATPVMLCVSTGFITNLVRQKFKNRQTTRGSKRFLLAVIIVANIAVYILWQNPSPNTLTILEKYMVANVYGPSRNLAMVGATFSHMDPHHLMANMCSLAMTDTTDIEPCTFLHIYITGGLVTALGSYIHSIVKPWRSRGSIGASGAIYSVFGYSLAKRSFYSLSPLSHSARGQIPSSIVFMGITMFELLGLLLNEDRIDHVGHLCGFSFGWLMGKLHN